MRQARNALTVVGALIVVIDFAIMGTMREIYFGFAFEIFVIASLLWIMWMIRVQDSDERGQ